MFQALEMDRRYKRCALCYSALASRKSAVWYLDFRPYKNSFSSPEYYKLLVKIKSVFSGIVPILMLLTGATAS